MTGRMFSLVIPSMAAGFILDLLVGDPHWLYHPVRLVGLLVSALEKAARKWSAGRPERERRAGVFLVLATVSVTTLAALVLAALGLWIHPALGFFVMTLQCYWLFAVRSLRDESMKVYDRLKAQDLPGARRAVSMIVGRDTQNLTREGVAKAAVETVAENTSDGIIAPMFYMAIGGPVLGWCYKAINTMDSMVGYKNEAYLNLGRCAARLDDAANYIPARLSALLMIALSPLAGLKAKEAFRIFRRDRYNHASPNSAQTEAVMAGALGVQLAGDAWYFGRLTRKKTIGDPGRPVEPEDICRANRLLYIVSTAALGLFLAVRGLALWLILR